MAGAMAGSAILSTHQWLNDPDGGINMGGAMAGSALLDKSDGSTALDTVTLTINNSCNLQCPKCYLQYDGQKEPMQPEVYEHIISSARRGEFRHLAIIGKEPTLSPETFQRIAYNVVDAGRTVSMITNGLALDNIPREALAQLKFVDVSLDGGPRTYRMMRGADYDLVGRNIARMPTHVRALHTIERRNIEYIDDMLCAGQEFDAQYVLFSPYLESRNDRTYSKDNASMTQAVPLDEMFRRFSENDAFRTSTNAYLLVSGLSLQQDGLTKDAAQTAIVSHRLQDKVLLDAENPICRGFLRVNYDGAVMTPFEGLHPRDWGLHNRRLGEKPLQELYQELHQRELQSIRSRSVE
jgi:hypothetical protein